MIEQIKFKESFDLLFTHSECRQKSGSFGFVKRWLVCRDKTKCATCVVAIKLLTLANFSFRGVRESLRLFELKKVRWKNKKYRRVGNECRLTYRSVAIWFANVLNFKFQVGCFGWSGRPTIGYNVLRLGGRFNAAKPLL